MASNVSATACVIHTHSMTGGYDIKGGKCTTCGRIEGEILIHPRTKI